jgi:FdhE protein
METSNSKKELSLLYGKKELSDSYISFQIDLFDITTKFRNSKDFVFIKPLRKDLIQNNFKSGIPLVAFAPITVSLDILKKCFSEILSVFISHNTCSKDTVARFKKEIDKGFIQDITSAISSYNLDAIQTLSKSTPLDAPSLHLATSEMAKPMFQTIAIGAKKSASFENWAEGFCPICGDLPGFARLSKEDEGKRYLWCKKCNLEWGFRRIHCPYCGNTDHNKLKFLTTNHREELRIDVCNDCNGYTKTIDERKIEGEETINFIRENVASLFLDIIADEKGYKIKSPDFLQTKITFQ